GIDCRILRWSRSGSDQLRSPGPDRFFRRRPVTGLSGTLGIRWPNDRIPQRQLLGRSAVHGDRPARYRARPAAKILKRFRPEDARQGRSRGFGRHAARLRSGTGLQASTRPARAATAKAPGIDSAVRPKALYHSHLAIGPPIPIFLVLLFL